MFLASLHIWRQLPALQELHEGGTTCPYRSHRDQMNDEDEDKAKAAATQLGVEDIMLLEARLPMFIISLLLFLLLFFFKASSSSSYSFSFLFFLVFPLSCLCLDRVSGSCGRTTFTASSRVFVRVAFAGPDIRCVTSGEIHCRRERSGHDTNGSISIHSFSGVFFLLTGA